MSHLGAKRIQWALSLGKVTFPHQHAERTNVQSAKLSGYGWICGEGTTCGIAMEPSIPDSAAFLGPHLGPCLPLAKMTSKSHVIVDHASLQLRLREPFRSLGD